MTNLENCVIIMSTYCKKSYGTVTIRREAFYFQRINVIRLKQSKKKKEEGKKL